MSVDTYSGITIGGAQITKRFYVEWDVRRWAIGAEFPRHSGPYAYHHWLIVSLLCVKLFFYRVAQEKP